jgi:hypothetical protein
VQRSAVVKDAEARRVTAHQYSTAQHSHRSHHTIEFRYGKVVSSRQAGGGHTRAVALALAAPLAEAAAEAEAEGAVAARARSSFSRWCAATCCAVVRYTSFECNFMPPALKHRSAAQRVAGRGRAVQGRAGHSTAQHRSAAVAAHPHS